jgi:hypothetical protein
MYSRIAYTPTLSVRFPTVDTDDLMLIAETSLLDLNFRECGRTKFINHRLEVRMADATTLFHTTLQYNGVLLHTGVLSGPKLQKIISRTAPKRPRITDGDIVKAVTSRDGTFEIDGWRIRISAIRMADRAW